MRRTAITPSFYWQPKYKERVREFEHPDAALNAEYLAAGVADDHESPLCVGIHQGQICRRPARKGARFCWEGRGDVEVCA